MTIELDELDEHITTILQERLYIDIQTTMTYAGSLEGHISKVCIRLMMRAPGYQNDILISEDYIE